MLDIVAYLREDNVEQPSFAEVGLRPDLVDALPAFVFIADADMKILDLNAAASRWLAASRNDATGKKAGEVLNCGHSTGTPEGCGGSDHCSRCGVRNSVRGAIRDRRLHGGRTRKNLRGSDDGARVFLQVIAAPFEHAGKDLALLVMHDVTELTRLRRLLPVCANCRSSRRDAAYLKSVEAYLNGRPELDYAHAICPGCRNKLYPGLDA